MLKIYFQKILHHIFPRLHFQSLRCDWQEIFYQIKKQFFCLKIPKPYFFFIIPTCPLKKQKPRILCERRIWHQSALGFFFNHTSECVQKSDLVAQKVTAPFTHSTPTTTLTSSFQTKMAVCSPRHRAVFLQRFLLVRHRLTGGSVFSWHTRACTQLPHNGVCSTLEIASPHNGLPWRLWKIRWTCSHMPSPWVVATLLVIAN